MMITQQRNRFFFFFKCLLLFAVICPLGVAHGQTTYASPERSAKAIGHYARARSLLVEALAEFEAGRRTARPDVLLDPEEWRTNVISRTEDLNRLLDPQPRVTRSGVRFKANRLQVQRDHERTARPTYGAQDSNTYGEEERRAELSGLGARTVAPAISLSTMGAKSAEPQDKLAPGTDEVNSVLFPKETPSTTLTTSEKTKIVKPIRAESKSTIPKDSKDLAPGVVSKNPDTTPDDDAVSEAISEAIKNRLEKIKSAKDKATKEGEGS
ncbi:MAG: hypothetical protein IT291_05535 [Deltaproteobacteria bacterium]|nr:hypothetical protein [Deltaproteobacteria bacterium]